MSRINAQRNHIFIDGQNLYLSAKRAFGLRYPDFDILALGRQLSEEIDPSLETRVRFYIGMPVRKYSPMWTGFWTNKLAAARESGVEVVTRELRYLTETDPNAPGGYRVLSAREKGIDLRLALDVMAASRRPDCANIMIVSRDQDFQEVVRDIRTLCDFTRREIGLWSAFPEVQGEPSLNRGIDGTRMIRITREIYDRVRDPADYRDQIAPPRPDPVTVAGAAPDPA
ncbi:uncharacterized LabA/DUF88 family protein [Gemmobacter caeni]|uniref:Uncharacterized LabA/DUF88 family protein n=1 Tax=Gemmobacter caeni TaxID=589035 RepID=A0A2T6B949_9RHOB|nr:NYN domain-containing protein [Gemmobacter caeni]PTX52595.1 uncharacterized LabA/DUF88 family protein [Gemmobacter caeni]TWI94948.1 uncharacterized LabA/DUF88 family protein [Gemmobacter caeni]